VTDTRLRVSEIFFSLQGEGRRTGLPTVFVRLTGCPLRCGYCDTTYAFQGGEWRGIASVLAAVTAYPTRHVCVTGGEPLAQKDCPALLSALCDVGFDVALETSGALDVGAVDPRVSRIVDVKTPGSREVERNLWSNLTLLGASDEVKFVLVDEADYRWAAEVVAQHRLADRCEVLFSPAHGSLKPRDLADWIVRDGLQVRMQLQLHKQLWGEEPGR
jgi:7-carboxy-7-deazaguanine synthase